MKKNAKYLRTQEKELDTLKNGVLRKMLDPVETSPAKNEEPAKDDIYYFLQSVAEELGEKWTAYNEAESVEMSCELDRIAEETGALWLYDGEPVSIEAQKGFNRFLDIVTRQAIDFLKADTREVIEQHRQATAAQSWAALHDYELKRKGLTHIDIEKIAVALYRRGGYAKTPITSAANLGYTTRATGDNVYMEQPITGNAPQLRINRAIKQFDEKNPAQIRRGGAMTITRLEQYVYLENLVLMYDSMEQPPQIAAEAREELEALQHFFADTAATEPALYELSVLRFLRGKSWAEIADGETITSRYAEDSGEEIEPQAGTMRKRAERFIERWNEQQQGKQ